MISNENTTGFDRRILIAGMKRSGSTWLYNVVRYCFINSGLYTYGDYVDRYNPNVSANVHIVKIHPFNEMLLQGTNLVFTTIRDIRDVAASLVRRKSIPNEKTEILETTREILKEEYVPWVPYSNLEIRYEFMIGNRIGCVMTILNLLNITNVDPGEVVHDVDKLTRVVFPGRERISQLWPNHITDGRVNSYLYTLNAETIRAIELEVGEWLSEHHYQIHDV